MKKSLDEKKMHPEVFKKAPGFTAGSIVLSSLLKVIAIIAVTFLMTLQYNIQQFWWLPLMALFLFVVYPIYANYQEFERGRKDAEKDMLCASCRHYNPTGVTCIIFDQHVTPYSIPCEGQSWESAS